MASASEAVGDDGKHWPEKSLSRAIVMSFDTFTNNRWLHEVTSFESLGMAFPTDQDFGAFFQCLCG